MVQLPASPSRYRPWASPRPWLASELLVQEPIPSLARAPVRTQEETHIIPDDINLDLSSSKPKGPIKPLLGPLCIFWRLVPHKSESTFRVDLDVGNLGILELGRRREVGLEGGGCDGRGKVQEYESGPADLRLAYDVNCLSASLHCV